MPIGAHSSFAASFVQVKSQTAATLVQNLPIARITLTQEIAPDLLPALTIAPLLKTQWTQISPTQFEAFAVGMISPGVTYKLQIPTSLKCGATCTTATSRSVSIYSAVDIIWEEQLLAQLGYLPVGFTPAGSTTPTTTLTTESTIIPPVTSTTTSSTSSTTSSSTTSTTTTTTKSTTTNVPTTTLVLPRVTLQHTKPIVAKSSGPFNWLYPSLPQSFIAQWKLGVTGPILKGALMSFQDVHGIPTTGVTTPHTWNALISDAKNSAFSPRPYNYVDVAMNLVKRSPQVLTLYISGVPSFHSLANAGIPQAPSDPGTYPVYLRYASTTMAGTNPDGSKYYDTGIPWVSYYNGGEGLHGFIRSRYGSSQSLGCIELPFTSAKTIWPHTPIGTLVTVRV